MITAWTYATAPETGWYWNSPVSGPVVYIEDVGMPAHFRRVVDGSMECYQSNLDIFRGQPLPRMHWPSWLLELDDMWVDEGL
jgi:hypothetical protein